MGAFFRHDGRYRRHGTLIDASKLDELLLQVTKNDAFDRDGGCADAGATEQASDQSKDESAEPAKPIALAARPSPPFQFGPEDFPVPTLVPSEFQKLWNQVRCEQSRHDNLARVDRDGAELACMVDLQDSTSKVHAHFRPGLVRDPSGRTLTLLAAPLRPQCPPSAFRMPDQCLRALRRGAAEPRHGIPGHRVADLPTNAAGDLRPTRARLRRWAARCPRTP